MANNCDYKLLAVCENKESLQKLYNIFRRTDKDFYLYRVFSVIPINSKYVERHNLYCIELEKMHCQIQLKGERHNLYCIELAGDVAWSCNQWIAGVRDDKKCVLGFYRLTDENDEILKKDGNDVWSDEQTAKFTTLPELCEQFKIAMEIFSFEPGVSFTEHYVISKNGEVVIDDCDDIEVNEEDFDNIYDKEFGFKQYMKPEDLFDF